jgi:hypothetical protein
MADQSKKRIEFSVDQSLWMHSPHTDEDTCVIYRGRMSGTSDAVVYDPASGWQGIIPISWLRPIDSDTEQE